MSLRIVLVGQAAFGEKTLERLAAEHEVVAVYCPPDAPGGKPDPLKAKAASLGIPVAQPKSMKGDEVYETFRSHHADLAILAYVTVIVPERVIRLPRLGTLCFHPSLLPRYRGGSAINWQIMRGETRGGLTVFWTDAGIDTGPILFQKEIPIGSDDTAGSYYYDKIFPLGIDALVESVRLVEEGRAPRIPQDDSQASYDPLCRDQHVAIEWARPAREVYDLVRGADPQPGAWAMRAGGRVRFYDARLEGATRAGPGEIAAIDERGLVIGLAGGSLGVGRVRVGDSGMKEPPVEAERRGEIAVGERLDSGSVTWRI